MTWIFIVFLGIALILWLTTFGYLLNLSAFAKKTKSLEIDTESLPEITDVDARLEPSCPPELVSCLVNDPSSAIMGAFVQPRTPLPGERLYWWFLSHLWWLEGEVLSSANISGVCYAGRREQLLPLAWDAYADDINVALNARARGHRVRICRSARAEEVRVPQTALDIVRFRRKRGKEYLAELKRPPKNILRDGFDDAFLHATKHNCGDCWLPFMNERKVAFGLRPFAIRQFLARG